MLRNVGLISNHSIPQVKNISARVVLFGYPADCNSWAIDVGFKLGYCSVLSVLRWIRFLYRIFNKAYWPMVRLKHLWEKFEKSRFPPNCFKSN